MKNKTKPIRKELKGETIVSGVAIGRAVVLGKNAVEFPEYWIHDGEVKKEVQRVEQALKECQNQLEQIKSKLCHIEGRDHISILDSHVMLLQDELLIRSTIQTIKKEHINAEWAVHKTISEIKQTFSKINQSYLKERKFDIEYIENAILRHLTGLGPVSLKKIPKGAIVVAFDLSPAEILQLVRCNIEGIITEAGGQNSHTSIVARSLDIPYVIGIQGILGKILEKDLLIIDGSTGKIMINPTLAVKSKLAKLKKEQASAKKKIKQEAHLDAKTTDGTHIEILANVEILNEIELFKSYGAQGVGLFRTEFLFLGSKAPTEKEQEKDYKHLLKKMKHEEVTVRTIDLGSDKLSGQNSYPEQANPALGLRAIRFCLQEKKLFSEQLRALIKAARWGNLKILIPMISSSEEFKRIKKIILDTMDDLRKEQVKIPDYVPIGVMIETPAAVVEMDLLARDADFFSVGTNDLIQYLLAVDRANDLVSDIYNPLHPSVIRTLKVIMDTANRYGKEVTLCGEMAGDPRCFLLLIALGYHRLSMNVASIPKIKKMIRMISLSEAHALLDKVLSNSSYKDNQHVIDQKLTSLYPEYFQ